MFLRPDDDDFPHPERLQPMEWHDESGRGFIAWALGLFLLTLIVGGLALADWLESADTSPAEEPANP